MRAVYVGWSVFVESSLGVGLGLHSSRWCSHFDVVSREGENGIVSGR